MRYRRRESTLDAELPSLAPRLGGTPSDSQHSRGPVVHGAVNILQNERLKTIQQIKDKIDHQINLNVIQTKKHISDRNTMSDITAENKTKRRRPTLGQRNKETMMYECSNLTHEEEKGLSSLVKRISDGEIIVATSDKSGRFVVLQTDQYVKSGLKHTSCDQQIGPDELRKIQSVLNSHTKWLKNIFNIGASWGHEERFTKNLTENCQYIHCT